MIDLRRLREEPDYRLGIERKRVAPGLLGDLVAADDARRALLTEVEENGAIVKKEVPFLTGVLADLSGDKKRDSSARCAASSTKSPDRPH